MAEREWVLLNPGPAMGTLTPLDMKGVVEAVAASLEELGIAPAPRR